MPGEPKILTRAGVAVTAGVLAAAKALNAEWNKWIATGCALCHHEAGMTLDGRDVRRRKAGGMPRWLHGVTPRLRRRVRAPSLVGGGTVRDDNPKLTIRGSLSDPTTAGGLDESRAVADKGSSHRRIQGPHHRAQGIGLARPCVISADAGWSACSSGGAHVPGEAFDRQLVDGVCCPAPLITGGFTHGRGRGVKDRARSVSRAGFRRVGADVRPGRRSRRDRRRLRHLDGRFVEPWRVQGFPGSALHTSGSGPARLPKRRGQKVDRRERLHRRGCRRPHPQSPAGAPGLTAMARATGMLSSNF